ncbi:hypothetical protein [Parashewanella tropica]|uniref:hypothetical protein n=1 Tax=Parashewanella tropica TaxID=2547970 RepID=UPI001059EC40|nr:hypothetical protein [Parashewanella tropica]
MIWFKPQERLNTMFLQQITRIAPTAFRALSTTTGFFRDVQTPEQVGQVRLKAGERENLWFLKRDAENINAFREQRNFWSSTTGTGADKKEHTSNHFYVTMSHL